MGARADTRDYPMLEGQEDTRRRVWRQTGLIELPGSRLLGCPHSLRLVEKFPPKSSSSWSDPLFDVCQGHRKPGLWKSRDILAALANALL
jgi:hypothetical protein